MIKANQDGSINTFNYNQQGQLINETQYSNSKQKLKDYYWVWLDTMPVAQIEIPYTNNITDTQQITYIHTDHLNTPRSATNQAKQTVWNWPSDAYGATLANQDPLNTGKITTIPLRFPGQYYDQETGLHYNYYRTYNPDLGRYTQPDPIGLGGGWNLFAYIGGNPINWSDALELLKTDENGHPIFTPSLGDYAYSHPSRPSINYPAVLGYIETDNGTKIPALKLDLSKPPFPLDLGSDNYDYSKNCHGVTFGNGDPLNIDEKWGQVIIDNDNYQQVSPPYQQGDIVIYYDKSGQSIHSATVIGTFQGNTWVQGKGGIEKGINSSPINQGFGNAPYNVYRKNR